MPTPLQQTTTLTALNYSEYDITPILVPAPSGRRPGRRIRGAIRFIVAHDTGNPGASARAHAEWYRRDPNPDRISSAHLFVDDREIIECIPVFSQDPEQALHVLYTTSIDNQLYGVDANRAAIGVEYCFGGSINADKAYNRYVWVIAHLCRSFELNPKLDVVGHHVLDPTRKIDPVHGLKESGRTYEGLLADVVKMCEQYPNSQMLLSKNKLIPGPSMTTVWLNIREQPKIESSSIRVVEPRELLEIEEIVTGDVVFGNENWCKLSTGGYCWSGGLQAL